MSAITDPAPETLDEELFGDAAGRRIGRTTGVLLMALLAVAAFTGGAFAQQRWGSGAATAAPAAVAPGGFPGGGAGFAGPAGGQAQAPGGAETEGQAAAAGPAVVGTVVAVSGRTLTVKNFAGRTVTVTVPEGAPVTTSTSTDLTKLTAGQPVTVAGSAAANGAVTATSVTARPAS